MSGLEQKHCVPCEKGGEPLSRERAEELCDEVPGWTLAADARSIGRDFIFKSFLPAIQFVDRVADVAEMEDHHPDIHLFYNKLRLELSTHAIKGLSENDFILAAKINAIV